MTSLGPGFHGGLVGHISVNASTSTDLVLKSSCSECGTSIDLYGSNCKHITFCFSCGTQRVKSQTPCTDCGMPVKLLIREYNVRAATVTEKNHFIGKFSQTLPNFSKKKGSDAKWTLHKEGLKGNQLTEALPDKYKNKPWALEEEASQQQFQGRLEGSQNASYYLLMLHGKEFTAIPAGSWYTFNKVAQYKQLSLEEAEEKMRIRKKNAEGYQRWLMKTAKDGAVAFGEVEKMEGSNTGTGGGRRKKSDDDGDDAALFDRSEEDGEEEEARKNRLGFNKKGDEDEDCPIANDHDVEEDDIEKGDDWEHEEVFTDDDEAVGNDPEEREDIGPEVQAPPEIKQDEEDGEGNEEEGEGLSKFGKELKKLLGKRSVNESEEEDDEYKDLLKCQQPFSCCPYEPHQAIQKEAMVDDEIGPKHKDVPKEPVETTPIKEKTQSTNSRRNATKSIKGKRKAGSEDVKPNVTTPAKKIKTEDSKQTASVSVKEEIAPTRKNSQSTKPVAQTLNKTAGVQLTGPVTEEELKTVLMQVAPITTQELVAKFKARLKSSEDKASFAAIVKKISHIQKTNGGTFVVLRGIQKTNAGTFFLKTYDHFI